MRRSFSEESRVLTRVGQHRKDPFCLSLSLLKSRIRKARRIISHRVEFGREDEVLARAVGLDILARDRHLPPTYSARFAFRHLITQSFQIRFKLWTVQKTHTCPVAYQNTFDRPRLVHQSQPLSNTEWNVSLDVARYGARGGPHGALAATELYLFQNLKRACICRFQSDRDDRRCVQIPQHEARLLDPPSSQSLETRLRHTLNIQQNSPLSLSLSRHSHSWKDLPKQSAFTARERTFANLAKDPGWRSFGERPLSPRYTYIDAVFESVG